MKRQRRHRVVSVVAFLALVPLSVEAIMSPSTGAIHGRVPTAAGRLLVSGPNGDLDGIGTVMLTAKPLQYGVSADTTDLILTDLDDDTGLTTAVDVTAVLVR